MDLNADDADPQRAQKASQLKWDKKRKRFVKDTPGEDNKKMIRGESGALLPATFKSGRYAEWKKNAHRHSGQRSAPQSHKSTGLASADTILKGRREKEKVSWEGTGRRLTVVAAAEERSRTEEAPFVRIMYRVDGTVLVAEWTGGGDKITAEQPALAMWHTSLLGDVPLSVLRAGELSPIQPQHVSRLLEQDILARSPFEGAG
jgi:hypothetical protein